MRVCVVFLVVATERAREEAAAALGDEIIHVVDDDGDDEGQRGLTFDDTSEFVRAIAYNPVAPPSSNSNPAHPQRAEICRSTAGKRWKGSRL